MTWAAARAAVRDLLADMAITEPSTETVRRVHEFPPGAIEPGDVPCVIMLPPAIEQEWGPNSSRILFRTMRVQFLARDENAADAAHICDSFVTVAANLLLLHMRLGAIDPDLTIVTGPQIEEPQGFAYGAARFLGFEMRIRFQYDTNEVFAI